ncbi:MAG: tetratricopeptide repeat protein [Bryobacteraceae bacterium]
MSSLHLDSPQPIPTSKADIPYLFADATDVVELPETTVEKAGAALDLSWRQDRALHLILILLDREADDEARRIAVECLEEFLADSEVSAFVCNRLYSAPLPDSADMVGALLLAESASASRLDALLEDLGESQAEICRRRREWDALAADLFDGPQAKLGFGYVAVTSGTFRRVVQSEPGQINSVLVEGLADRRFQRLANFRNVLTSWIPPVRADRKLAQRSEEEEEDDRSYARTSDAARPKRSHAVFENVKKQKEAIKQAISEGRTAQAAKYVDDLVAYQLKRSEREDTAKSLCDLAMHAKSVGAHELQLKLVELATKILPSDGWSQAQLGDALLCVGRFSEALDAHRTALECGNVEVARNGRAEVLKALGRLDEALREYEEVVRDFPHNVVARNGRAEVLKALGRLDEALREYEEVVSDFPQDVVARTGRAEVLKALGRLDEALREYEEVVRDFPQDVVARNGRAEVLKALGRLDEALREYEEVVRDFPHNVVARTGRAEVLKAQGRLDEALREYEEVVRDFPHDVIARNGRAEVLKALGRLDEALREYEEAVRDFPHDLVAPHGRAEVLKAMGRLDEALREYREILSQFPNDSYSRNGMASVLVLLARYYEALEILPQEEPRTVDDWIGYHIRGMISLKTGDASSAIDIFWHGLHKSPWHETRAGFGRALAVARLRRSEFPAAAEALGGERSPVSDVLRIHAFGGLGEIQEAGAALERIKTNRHPTVAALLQELATRYVVPGRGEALRSDEWVFEREFELELTA